MHVTIMSSISRVDSLFLRPVHFTSRASWGIIVSVRRKKGGKKREGEENFWEAELFCIIAPKLANKAGY